MLLIILFSSILALFIYLVLIEPNRYWKKQGVPYIKPVPIFGNMFSNVLQLRSFNDMINDFYNAYPNNRYVKFTHIAMILSQFFFCNYRYVGLFQFRTPTLMIRDLELIKKITIKEFDTFPDHKPFTVSNADPIASKTLFNLTCTYTYIFVQSLILSNI